MAEPRSLPERSPPAPAEGSPDRRVELVHESLLTKWPRLVRWRTQDAEGAQLRDELRQAAQLWEQHGRGEDFLWTGTAFREYALWRERYPGGLTELEEAFAEAMTALASRHRRRRRLALATVITVLLVVLGVVGALWQRGRQQTRRAEAEAARAEATKLVALGQLELEKNASSAIAHAIASLELNDGIDARRLALEALWKGPTAFVVHEDAAYIPSFSPDGRLLVHSGYNFTDEVRIVWSDGRIELMESQDAAMRVATLVGPQSDVVATVHKVSQSESSGVSFWSIADRRPVASVMYQGGPPPPFWNGAWDNDRFLLGTIEGERAYLEAVRSDGSRERLGMLTHDPRSVPTDLNSRRVAMIVDHQVRVQDISEHDLSGVRILGRDEGSGIRLVLDPSDRFVATFDDRDRIRLWPLAGSAPTVLVQGPAQIEKLWFTDKGSLLVAQTDQERALWVWSFDEQEPRLLRRFDLLSEPKETAAWYGLDPVGGHLARVDWDRKIRLWSFQAPADAEPLLIGRNEPAQLWPPSFDPSGRWLSTGSGSGLTLYPLARRYASVLRHKSDLVLQVAFSADGRLLATLDGMGALRLWPLDGPVPGPGRSWSFGYLISLALSPDGKQALLGTQNRGVSLLIPLDGGPEREIRGFAHQASAVAFSPDGRLAAGAGGTFRTEENQVRIWSVATGEELRILEPEADLYEWALQFLDNLHVLSAAQDGLRMWNVETGESELLFSGQVRAFSASPKGDRILLVEDRGSWTAQDDSGSCGPALLLDLTDRSTTPLTTHGKAVCSVALDASGTIAVTGDAERLVRVGPVTGEEPHWLVGHESSVLGLAVDPLGRWIASASDDATVRLWPMPDVSKPPLHALPRAELIAKLKTLTNYRVRSDPESSTGWKLALDPFPGWETVPTW